MTEADVERRDAVRRPAPGPAAPVARRRAGPGPTGLGLAAGLGLTAMLLVLVALGIGPAPAAGAQTPPATSPTTATSPTPPATSPTTATSATADQAPAGQGGPQVVKVGLFVENISNLDLQEGSFQADFYLWFVWKGDIDPTKTYELTNALPLQLAAVAGSTTEDGTPVPDVQPDGNHQVFHVKGRFTSEFKTGNYPLDDANLVISVEDVKYDSSVLVYEFDNGSGMSANTKVTAREVRAPTARVTEHFYATSFCYEGEQGD
ncbi:MAG: hypothetical protein QOI56_635, partial [Actinomycetota bacterium]|nr:hypothetical protein [Actinomycetota bacterium]